ncbi:hypothetical protein ACHAW5_004146 [Stephanodiscus triporus]|uniref:Phosphoglycolate phosphatase n=1 Tax=Stephanodiscus triporus TaxID=2934178 RepID=A0ABD3MPA5_9STRA
MSFGGVARAAVFLSAVVEGFIGGGRMTTTGVVDARRSSPSSFEHRASRAASTESSPSSSSSSSTSNAASTPDDGGEGNDAVLGIIFDIDGTLADSWNLGYRATLTVLAGYHNERQLGDGDGDRSLSRHTPETYPLTPEEYHFGCRYTTPERLARHVGLEPDHPSFDSVGEDLGRKFDEYYVALVDMKTAGFYGGIGDLLVRLHRGEMSRSAAGGGGRVKLGALTNACVEYAHAVLKANCPQFSTESRSSPTSSVDAEDHYIYRRFSSIHGADSVPRPKPYGDGILQCCEDMDLHPSRVIYVGDAPTDARAAVDARCRAAIGVLWGSNDEECLKNEAGFAVLCSNVEELARAIERYL